MNVGSYLVLVWVGASAAAAFANLQLPGTDDRAFKKEMTRIILLALCLGGAGFFAETAYATLLHDLKGVIQCVK